MPIIAGTSKSSSVTENDADVDPLVVVVCQVGQHTGGRDPPGAEAEHVGVVASGERAGRVDRSNHGGGVLVEAPMGVLGSGFAPTHDEDLNAAADLVLHEAAARRQVEEVVLVDLWGDHHHRT